MVGGRGIEPLTPSMSLNDISRLFGEIFPVCPRLFRDFMGVSWAQLARGDGVT